MNNEFNPDSTRCNNINCRDALNCYRDAVKLIRKKPLPFIVSACTFFITWLLISWVSITGQSILIILFPVWLAGFYSMTRAAKAHSSHLTAHLLNGFKQCFLKLLALGLLFYFFFLLFITVIFVCFIALSLGDVNAESLHTMENMANIDKVNFIMAHFSPTFISWAFLATGLLTLVPILISLFCSPYLIYFKGLSLFDACYLSMSCFIKNVLPVSLFFVLSILLIVLALLPLALGMIIILPLVLVSSYLCCEIMFIHEENITTKENLFSDR